MHLDFQGTCAEGLLLTLLLGVSAVLCAHGVWLCVHRRRRAGVLSLLAVGGPATAAVGLLADAGWCFWRGDSAVARRSLLAGLLATVLSGIVAVMWECTGLGGAFWLALLGSHITIATMLIYASTYRAIGTGRFFALLALRLIAVAALLLILFKPVLILPADADLNKPILAVLLDRSGSMATQDQPDSPSRHTQASEMLLSQAQRLDETFRVQWFDFAATAATARSAEALARRSTTGPGTDATDIAAGLKLAGQTNPDAGVVLLSDGIQNVSGDPAAVAEARHAPVYAVAVGSTASAPSRANLQVLRVDAPLQAAVDHETDITAQVRMTRLANTQAQVQLFEGDAATPIATETISTADDDATVPVKFTWTPRESSTGLARLCVRVVPNAIESINDDNEIRLHVAMSSPAIRVLYIEGAVRPEYKYLHRLMQSDPNVQFAGLVRISGNRFWSQGKLDGVALAGLPTTDEDFHRFDVLILGDLDASFLGVERMDRIRRFVADGGGLLMLGGQNSFGPGGYSRTGVEAALPVVVGGKNQPQIKQPFLPQLTNLGAEFAIFAGIAEYFPREGEVRSAATHPPLPKLQGCVSVLRAKPAAAVLAVHPTQRNEAGALPVLVVEPFGAGRSAALTVDTTWRWYLPLRAMGAKSPYARFWGQLIRWLAGADAVTRRDGALAVLRAERTYARAGESPIPIQALLRNADGTSPADANVTVTLQPKANTGKESSPATILLKNSDAPGVFEGEIAPMAAGEFVLQLTATNEKGETLGTDELPFRILASSSERDQTARNDTLLHAIADRSRGRFVELSALPNLLDSLIAQQRHQAGPPPQPQVQRLYNFPAMFVVFVLLLTAEWILRRRWQLR